MNVKKFIAGIFCSLIMSMQPAFATLITAEVTHITGNTWETNYTITNNTLAEDIEWFAIYFPSGLYENIVDFSPADIVNSWDIIVQQPDDPFAGSEGYFDAFSFPGFGIEAGKSLSNFIVRFDYLGTDTISFQDVEIYDPNELNPVVIDYTQLESILVAVAVPAPHTLPLFFVSLIAFGALRKSVKRNIL
jgi:hypothetical protein